MAYNLTNVTSATNALDHVGALNSVSGGVLGLVLLFIIWFMSYSLVNTVDTVDRWLYSLTITSVLGLFMYFGNWIQFEFLLVPIFVLVIFLGIKMFKG